MELLRSMEVKAQREEEQRALEKQVGQNSFRYLIYKYHYQVL